jgi:hypothetical protein
MEAEVVVGEDMTPNIVVGLQPTFPVREILGLLMMLREFHLVTLLELVVHQHKFKTDKYEIFIFYIFIIDFLQ